MRNIFKLFGIIALAALIGFSFNACIEENDTVTHTNDEDSWTDDTPPPVPVIGINLDKNILNLIKDETETLTATVKNTDNKAVTWNSANTAVATVNNNGVVIAVKSGTTVITATMADGGKTAQCTIIVYPADMVRINKGTFEMGQSFVATPKHLVTLTNNFYMGKYEVTQEQYQAVMGTNPSYFDGNSGKEPVYGEDQGKRPVENVSWYDAILFCNKLSMMGGLSPAYSISNSTDPAIWGTAPRSPYDDEPEKITTWDAVEIVAGSTGYRLPTEAQWEYACRAGTTTKYNTGDEEINDLGWYSRNSYNHENDSWFGTRQVGLKPPNAWGLYDMHGNVWEWCWDWYHSYGYNAQTDPMRAEGGSPYDTPERVMRGGAFFNGATESARRNYRKPWQKYEILGFRLVRP